MTVWCSICLSPTDDTQTIHLPCKCTGCSDCLTSWIITQASELHYQTHENILCMDTGCKKPFKIQQVFTQFNQQEQDVINAVLYDVYLKKTEDIRKCPNSQCSYAGVLDTSGPCKDNLECSMCGTQWREKIHYTKFEKIMEVVKSREIKSNELYSIVWEETFTRRCPKCSVNIQKNGGCPHMTCKKCQYEFCWLCTQRHQGHSWKFCRLSILMKLMMLMFPLIHILWLTGIGPIFSMIVGSIASFILGGVVVNLLFLDLYGLYKLYNKRRFYCYTRRRKREYELLCFGLGIVAALLIGMMQLFDLYDGMSKAVCIEALLAIVLRDHMWKVMRLFSYSGDIIRYIRWNRRLIYVYARSYFIR